MQILKNTSNLLLALLILGSTMGVTLHKHHCMGSVRHLAINEKAPSCMGNVEMPGDMDCCTNTSELLKVENMDKTTFYVDLSPSLVRIAYVLDFTTLKILPEEDQLSVHNGLYKPPLIEQDVVVLVQSFLI